MDERGAIFARATTAWLLIEPARRRAVPLGNLPHPVHYQADQFALDRLPEKLPAVVSPELLYTRNVAHSDLDLYGHVNNARYVDFILDAYDQSFHRAHQPKALAISPLKRNTCTAWRASTLAQEKLFFKQNLNGKLSP